MNVSLIKTRCRASRRGEGFSPVGVRLPNPYENVHLCLEFAIYQTHVKHNKRENHINGFSTEKECLQRRVLHIGLACNLCNKLIFRIFVRPLDSVVES